MARFTGSINAGVLIVCGALNALLSKVVYQLQGQDCSGTTKEFQKPWLQTALMFVAMAFCLPVGWVAEAWEEHAKKKKRAAKQGAGSRRKTVGISVAAAEPAGSGVSEPLLAERAQERLQHHEGTQQRSSEVQQQQQQGGGRMNLKEGLLLCIPTGFDLTATTLMNVGLLYVAASVFQILRGSEMVFAALFAVVFLKRHLNKWHFIGVALCMAGISLVGVSRVLAGGDSGSADSLEQQPQYATSAAPSAWQALNEGGAGPPDPKKALLGMCLILLSQAIQAAQVTVEDHFMSELGIHPLKVVGWEGVIGSAVMLGGALPLLQHLPFEDGSGLAEDSAGSWCMMKSSGTIALVLTLSSLAVLVYNISGMYVTEQIGAAARTVLENARTLLVWLAALGLYYLHVGGDKVKIGEAWDQWSWLQAVGFAVFASGALLYDKGHKVEEDRSIATGQMPKFSKWAVLKSTLNIHTGHFVGIRRFRAAGNAVIAGLRLQQIQEDNNESHNDAERSGDLPDSLEAV